MRGVKFENLLYYIMEFLYRAEANVFQESLDSFLAIAKDLEVMRNNIYHTIFCHFLFF